MQSVAQDASGKLDVRFRGKKSAHHLLLAGQPKLTLGTTFGDGRDLQGVGLERVLSGKC